MGKLKNLFRRALCCLPLSPIHRKLVFIGDEGVGKTALLSIHTRGTFPEKHEPTIFENYIQEALIDDRTFHLSLVDTAGHHQMETVRSLSYADTHVVILCFSVDQPETLANVINRWMSELAVFCPGVAVVLLACKCDLREDPATERRLGETYQHPVTFEEGMRAAEMVGALRYLECSAMHDIGVNEVFEQTARVALDAKPHGAPHIPINQTSRPPSSCDHFFSFASRDRDSNYRYSRTSTSSPTPKSPRWLGVF